MSAGELGFSVMNDCKIYTSIEMFYKPTQCTYAINNIKNLNVDEIEIGNFCLLTSDVTIADIRRVFKGIYSSYFHHSKRG